MDQTHHPGPRRWAAMAIAAALGLATFAFPCLPPAAALAAPAVSASRSAQDAAREAAEARAYQDLVAHLASPEMEGRGAGTKGIERARDLLVQELTQAGLRPAFGASYVQELRVPTGVEAERQELAIVADKPDPAAVLAAGKDFQAMGFSAQGAFEGEAVFAGYSVVDPARKYDSYAGAGKGELKGKVAVILRYEPADANGVSLWTGRNGSWTNAAALAAKVAQAASRGAAAVLIVNPAGNDSDALDPAGRTGLGRGGQVPVIHIARRAWQAILKAAGRADDESALRKAADEGTLHITPLGIRLRGQVKLRPVQSSIHNVAGLLSGAGPLADQFIVVGAHYDHVGSSGLGSRDRSGKAAIHPGADDNASGAAGVAMLGRWLTQRSRAGAATAPAAAPPLRRSILFVTFAGEELGLLGSRHLVDHVADVGIRREQIAAMVNLDMIGRLRNGQLSVWGVDSGDRLRRIVTEAAEGTDLKLRMSGSGFGASDHSSFYRAGIPVLGLNTGMHADVHMPTDTADKIIPDGAVRVLRLAEAVLDVLATDEQRIAYVPPGKTGGGAGGAFLGISFDADYQGAGCRVGSVVSGGPAQQAGIRDGDLITQWEGKDIADSDALMVLIRHSQPGTAVKLTIRRAGKTQELQVKLGGR